MLTSLTLAHTNVLACIQALATAGPIFFGPETNPDGLVQALVRALAAHRVENTLKSLVDA